MCATPCSAVCLAPEPVPFSPLFFISPPVFVIRSLSCRDLLALGPGGSTGRYRAVQGGTGRYRAEDDERPAEAPPALPPGSWGGWTEVPKPVSAAAAEKQQQSGGGSGAALEGPEGQAGGAEEGGAGRDDNKKGGEGEAEGEEEGSEEGSEEEGEVSEAEDEDDGFGGDGDVSEAELLERLGVKLEADLEAMQARGMEPPVLHRCGANVGGVNWRRTWRQCRRAGWSRLCCTGVGQMCGG